MESFLPMPESAMMETYLNDFNDPMLFGGDSNPFDVSDLDMYSDLMDTPSFGNDDLIESLHQGVKDEEDNNFFVNDNNDPFSDHDYTPMSPTGSHSTGGSSSPTNTISSVSDYGSLDILGHATQEIFAFSPAPEPIPQQVPKTQLVSVRPSYRPLSQPMRKPMTTSHATQRPNPTFRFKPATQRTPTNPANISLNSPSSSVSSESGSYRPIEINHGERRTKYPKLILNEEEKRLCNKEGIRLPESYPLTKEEERNLKKIRRKIRNKKSAQTSRKRKQDYIEQLEDRVSDCTQENQELKAKLEALSRQNQSVMQQLRKLQSVLAQSTRRSAQAGTCLAVLILSMCLLVAPHLNPFIKQRGETLESEEAAMALSRNTHNLSVNEIAKRSATSRSRTLVEFAEVRDKQCPMVPSKPAVADMPSLEMIPAARRRAMPTHHHVQERVVHAYNQHNVKEPIKYAYYEPLVSNPPPRQINLSQHRVEYRVPSQHQQQRYFVQEPLAKRVKMEPL